MIFPNGYIHEQHCHSNYSGDVDKAKGSSIDGMCQRALELGLGSIAITDHLEIDQTMGNIFPPLDNEGIKRDIFEAKEKYKGQLEVVYGVELAQAMHKKEKTKAILEKYDYDYIIGSVHCVRSFPDFSDMDYDAVSDKLLSHAWELYIEETKEMISWGQFSTLAHITYPYRYYSRHGREHLLNIFENGREIYEPILKAIIEKGIALEVNTSGIRQNANTTFPHTDIVRFYRELGGELVTVGSDAHYACDIAANIGDTYAVLKDIGFNTIVTFRDKKPVYRKI